MSNFRRIWALAVLVPVFLMAFSRCAVADAVTDELPEDIFLLIGQSNMVGLAPITQLDQELVSGALLFNGKSWEPLCGVVQRYSTAIPSTSQPRLGPGYTFARKLAEMTGRKIGIVANARGATLIEWWQKGYTGENDYDLYEKAVEQVRLALEAAPNARLVGILWHQGESDNTAGLSPHYANRLQALVEDLRRDLNAPDAFVIAGEVGTWNGKGAYTNPQIHKAAEVIENTYWVSSAGLVPLLRADGTPNMDDPHFNTMSQRVLGERFADKALEVIYGLSPGAAVLYAGNELFTGLYYTGYSATLPVGDYDQVALERRGIDVTKIASLQVAPGYDVILHTAEGSVAVFEDTAALEEIVPGSVHAVSVTPSPFFARVKILEQEVLLALNRQRYQLQLPFGVTKAPEVEVSLLSTNTVAASVGENVGFVVTEPTSLPVIAHVKTVNQSGDTMHEADIRLTVAPLPDITVRLGSTALPLKEQTLLLRGRVTLHVAAAGPEELLAGCEAILTPKNTELPRVVWHASSALPREAPLDTLNVADGYYALTVTVTTLAGAVYELNQDVRVYNWDKQVDELFPVTMSSWFGSLNPRLTVSESAGWRSIADEPKRFCGDSHRLVGDRDDFLIWELHGAERYVIDLFTLRPELLSGAVKSAVSADMTTWSDLAYSQQVMGECAIAVGDGDKWQGVRLTGAITSEHPGARYFRILIQADDDLAHHIQLSRMELWNPAAH
jgi:hypothetical protein